MGLRNFWDSYAVIEFINGNPKFARFIHEPVTITIFNLSEIFWVALNVYDEKTALEIFDRYDKCVVNVNSGILKESIKFRKKVYKDKKISYADAIGYIYALKNNLIFLTGDKEFEDLENVEFVKK